MQLEKFHEAKLVLEQALRIDKKDALGVTLNKLRDRTFEIVYRYAFVLEVMGEADKATKIRDIIRYQPTHERLLLSKPKTVQ